MRRDLRHGKIEAGKQDATQLESREHEKGITQAVSIRPDGSCF